MISHKHRFIAIHIPKTGGKSVRKALRPFVLSPWQRALDYLSVRTIRRDLFGMDAGGSHATALATRDAVGARVYDDYFVFAMVRNPWALVVSEYYFMKKRPTSRYYDVVTRGSLDDYLDARIADGLPTQLDYLQDDDGHWAVDFVGFTEQADRDFDLVCDLLGIRASLPHKNRTQHKDYRDEHTSQSREKVARYFANDIAIFGYDFDHPNSGFLPFSVNHSLRSGSILGVAA